jgi:hypothetical protein
MHDERCLCCRNLIGPAFQLHGHSRMLTCNIALFGLYGAAGVRRCEDVPLLIADIRFQPCSANKVVLLCVLWQGVVDSGLCG